MPLLSRIRQRAGNTRMTTSSSAPTLSRARALQALREPGDDRPLVALISAAGPNPWSRRSLVARHERPLEIRRQADLHALFAALGPRREPPAARGEPGAVAILDYELGALLEPAASTTRRDADSTPLATLLRLADPAEPLPGAERESPDDLARIPYTVSPLRPLVPEREFTAAVRAALDHIAAGDAYQVNLTHPLRARAAGPLRALAADAIERTRARFAAFIQLPQRAILSTSPELLIRVTPAGRITARPIKGTRPAGGEAELLASGKDAAELAMIVDLMRNDLGRVCQPGSMRVDAPRLLERHAGVVHTVAEVSGDLRPEVEWEDVLRAVYYLRSVEHHVPLITRLRASS